MGDVTNSDHYVSTVTVTVEVTHQFPGDSQPENMIRNSLNFPAIGKLSINSIDTKEVKVK